MRKWVLDETHGIGRTYRLVEYNRLGERIAVQIRKAKADAGRGSQPKYWLSVTTLVTDKRGNVQEKYNPQVKITGGRRTVNKIWVLEPSTENIQKLLEQVERLAFGGQ